MSTGWRLVEPKDVPTADFVSQCATPDAFIIKSLCVSLKLDQPVASLEMSSAARHWNPSRAAKASTSCCAAASSSPVYGSSLFMSYTSSFASVRAPNDAPCDAAKAERRPHAQVADKEAGANCPAALVHAARTRARLGGKVKQRFQEGAVDEARSCHMPKLHNLCFSAFHDAYKVLQGCGRTLCTFTELMDTVFLPCTRSHVSRPAVHGKAITHLQP